MFTRRGPGQGLQMCAIMMGEGRKSGAGGVAGGIMNARVLRDSPQLYI